MGVHRFDPTVLREYDIRGIVGQTLGVADARAIGQGLGSAIIEGGGRSAAVARDGRVTSPAFAAAVIDGMLSTGLEVVDVGLGPTPMLYYAVWALDLDGGVMVTGSHNPSEYNGFKMMRGKKSFWGPDIQTLGRRAQSGSYATGSGSLRQRDIQPDYIARLVRDYRPGRPLNVCWDAGNGAAGPAMMALIAALPGQHMALYETVDGSFPNHHPDPTMPENLADLQAAVRRQRADLGIAFDGDGDRIGVVDDKGRILWGDQLMALFAREVLAENPGSTIIADVKASQVLFDEIARLGGNPLMWKTGHSIMKTKMVETGAPLAGEMSGHIFFADRWYGFDDALYCAVRLLSIVARGTQSLSAMRDSLPSVVNTPELRFPCSEQRKFAAVDEIKARLRARGTEMSDIDGVRVRTPDGWWLLRASNTQDVLVARCEAADEAGLERLKAALVGELGASGIEPPTDFSGKH
jgi:phosphomannomutase